MGYLSKLLLLMTGVGWVCTPTLAQTTSLTFDGFSKPVKPFYDSIGNAFFLREIYSIRTNFEVQIAKAFGFNALIDDAPRCFRQGFYATEANWWDKNTPILLATAEVERYHKHRNLLAINLNDEPDLRQHLAGPEHLKPLVTAIRTKFGTVKLSVTLAGVGRSKQAWPAYAELVDIIRIDPYPLIAGWPLNTVGQLVRQANVFDKPVVCILQGWTTAAQPLPDAEQYRFMAFSAMINGAAGISVYDFNPAVWLQEESLARSIFEVNHLIINDLEPFLTKGTRLTVIDSTAEAALFKLPDGQFRILVAGQGKVRLSGLKPLCDTLFDENQSPIIPQKNGTFILELGQKLTGVVLRPKAKSLNTNGLTWSTLSIPKPGKSERRYTADATGKPYRTLAPLPNRPVLTVPVGFSPFTDANANIVIRGKFKHRNQMVPYAFRVFAGGQFRYSIRFDKLKIDSLRIESCTLGDNTLPDSQIKQIFSLKQHHRRFYTLDAAIPEGVAHDQDLILTLRFKGLLRGQRVSEIRHLLLRTQQPYRFEWRWFSDKKGWFEAVPLFARYNHVVTFQVNAPGLYIWRKGNSNFFLVKRDPLAAAHLTTLEAVAISNGKIIQRQAVGNVFLLANGRLKTYQHRALPLVIVPHFAPKHITEAFKEAEAHGQFSIGFLEHQDKFLTTDSVRVMFIKSQGALWWLGQWSSSDSLRLETPAHDSDFLADDTAKLTILDQADQYDIEVNAGGVAAFHKNRYRIEKPVGCEVWAIQTGAKTWRFVIAWPYTGKIENLDVIPNLYRSIAPRKHLYWFPKNRRELD